MKMKNMYFIKYVLYENKYSSYMKKLFGFQNPHFFSDIPNTTITISSLLKVKKIRF